MNDASNLKLTGMDEVREQFHNLHEIVIAARANAAGSFGIPMFQSSVSKPELEETAKEVPEGLKIFQLYVRGDHAWVENMLDRAVAAGFGALCLTVDTHHYSRRERDISKRYAAASARTPEGARYQKGLDC